MILATLIGKEEIAKETTQFNFATEKPISFLPGQYCKIALPSLEFADPKGNERKFSFVNSPHENTTITIAMRMSGSGYKETLNRLPEGTPVEVTKIKGKFVLPEESDQQLIFIAGGIGITPFISMLRYMRDINSQQHVILFYFNRDTKSAAYLQELTKYQEVLAHFTLVLSITRDKSWKKETRKFTKELLKDHVQSFLQARYYTAGMPQMVSVVKNTLESIQINSNYIYTEDFDGYEK